MALESIIEVLSKDLDDKGIKLKQVRDIVDIKTWINTKYYIGDEIIYDYWKDVIIEFFEKRCNEIIFTGSTGTGKSYCALQIVNRFIYELSCYNYPALLYGLSPSSTIAMFYLSVTQKQAISTGFGKLMKIIDGIPYYRENFRRRDINSVIEFESKTIKIGCGSNISDFIGSDLFGIILDEANFVGGNYKDAYEKAKNIYREAVNRRKNRFVYDGGKEGGFSIIVSSADTEDSFVEKRIEELKNNNNVMIVKARKYDIDKNKYSGKKFYVYIGDSVNLPFIIKDDDIRVKTVLKQEKFDYDNLNNDLKSFVVDVPIEYYNSFKIDVINSLKEVCGIPAKKYNIFSYLTYDILLSNIDSNLKNPFGFDSVVMSSNDNYNILIHSLHSSFIGKDGIEYVVGLDTSLTSDNTGFCMCHYDIDCGKYVVDLCLAIKPPKDGYINLRYIEEFILYLRDVRKFNIKSIALDSFNKEFLYLFKNYGFNTYVVSIETNKFYYLNLFNKINNKEIVYYKNELLFDELLNLQILDDRIDHLKNKSKDVADALCRAIYILVENKSLYIKKIHSFEKMNNIVKYFNKNSENNFDYIYKDVEKFLNNK